MRVEQQFYPVKGRIVGRALKGIPHVGDIVAVVGGIYGD
jgi:hypothetical protein